ncbi:MAG: hypothetical protein V1827_03315 [Candidatus Micrarchaeota archaeon]
MFTRYSIYNSVCKKAENRHFLHRFSAHTPLYDYLDQDKSYFAFRQRARLAKEFIRMNGQFGLSEDDVEMLSALTRGKGFFSLMFVTLKTKSEFHSTGSVDYCAGEKTVRVPGVRGDRDTYVRQRIPATMQTGYNTSWLALGIRRSLALGLMSLGALALVYCGFVAEGYPPPQRFLSKPQRTEFMRFYRACKETRTLSGHETHTTIEEHNNMDHILPKEYWPIPENLLCAEELFCKFDGDYKRYLQGMEEHKKKLEYERWH